MNKLRIFSAICLAVVGSSVSALAGEYSVTKQMHVGGTGRWDYVLCDPATHRLYVPRSDHTQVIDAESGKVIADIPDTQGCHGVALAGDRGFISDSHGVTVFDTKTLKPLGTI